MPGSRFSQHSDQCKQNFKRRYTIPRNSTLGRFNKSVKVRLSMNVVQCFYMENGTHIGFTKIKQHVQM